MNKILLLPYSFKKIGWALFIPTAFLGLLMVIDGFNGFPTFLLPDTCQVDETVNLICNDVVLVGVLLGALLVTCSRERIEDEFIGRIRLNALLAALYVNIGISVVCTLVLYGFDYLYFMVVNIVGLPILFLVIERIMLWRLRKEVSHEEQA